MSLGRLGNWKAGTFAVESLVKAPLVASVIATGVAPTTTAIAIIRACFKETMAKNIQISLAGRVQEASAGFRKKQSAYLKSNTPVSIANPRTNVE